MRRTVRWALALLGLVFALGFGLWAQSLFVRSELVHFSVNFPSDGTAETMSCCDLGGPWARDRDPEWNDYPAGGVLAYGIPVFVYEFTGAAYHLFEKLRARS
jgi:hypothetical protein